MTLLLRVEVLLMWTNLKARGHVATRYQQHEECLSGVTSTFRSSVSTLQENVAKTKQSISRNSNAFAANTDARAASVREFGADSSKVVSVLKKRVFNHDLLDDVPTSETPKKRAYHIPESFPRTRAHDEILHQTNKMPLANVDVNLTTQTPAATRAHNMVLEKVMMQENSFEKKMVTPPYDNSVLSENVSTDGRENTVFKSRIAGPIRKRALGSH